MKHRVLFAAMAVSAGVLVAGTVAAASGERKAGGPKAVNVVEKTTALQFVELDPAGDSLGDSVVGASELFDRTDKKIGTSHWVCVRTNLGEQRHCTLTYFFADGFLTLQGPYRDNGTGTFAITGGTGVYRKARGWMDLTGTTTPDGGTTFVYTEVFHVLG
jgi:allene oxide cyclase